MILREKYVPVHLNHIYYKTKKFYKLYNEQHSLFDNDFKYLNDFIQKNDSDFLQNIIYSGFFFDKKILDFLIDNQYLFNDKNTFYNLYFSILTHNTKLFRYILNNEKIDINLYKKMTEVINRDFSFEYATILLEMDVDFTLKENFFIEACYYGKAKTVEYMLNEFNFSDNIINEGINKIIKQKKTGTFNQILKNPKVNFSITKNLIDLVVDTRDYRMIKKTYEHNNFDKEKYSVYLFELLFYKYKKMGDYYSTERYFNFMKEMLINGLSNKIPESVVNGFLNYKFNIIEDFFENRKKIVNF